MYSCVKVLTLEVKIMQTNIFNLILSWTGHTSLKEIILLKFNETSKYDDLPILGQKQKHEKNSTFIVKPDWNQPHPDASVSEAVLLFLLLAWRPQFANCMRMTINLHEKKTVNIMKIVCTFDSLILTGEKTLIHRFGKWFSWKGLLARRRYI